MRFELYVCLAVLAATLLVQPATADNITGAEKILCTTVEATECYAEVGCSSGSPEDWNIPRFVEIDFDNQSLSTTEASGERRSSSMKGRTRV